jgi:hypothetical protein
MRRRSLAENVVSMPPGRRGVAGGGVIASNGGGKVKEVAVADEAWAGAKVFAAAMLDPHPAAGR